MTISDLVADPAFIPLILMFIGSGVLVWAIFLAGYEAGKRHPDKHRPIS
jgi:hypothetical protein